MDGWILLGVFLVGAMTGATLGALVMAIFAGGSDRAPLAPAHAGRYGPASDDPWRGDGEFMAPPDDARRGERDR